MHWQLRHAVSAPNCDMTTTAFGTERRSLSKSFWGISRFFDRQRRVPRWFLSWPVATKVAVGTADGRGERTMKRGTNLIAGVPKPCSR
jgi:hypothetical protein